uniref:Uncharacterized protein n=1 Tax=Cannabis sativa TaxID=3483 RepID=A0A803R134_CANSA
MSMAILKRSGSSVENRIVFGSWRLIFVNSSMILRSSPGCSSSRSRHWICCGGGSNLSRRV